MAEIHPSARLALNYPCGLPETIMRANPQQTLNYTCTRCRSCPGGRVFLGARCHFVCRFQTRAREMLLQPVSTDSAMDAMSRELYTLPARNGRHTHVGAGIGEGCNPPGVLD